MRLMLVHSSWSLFKGHSRFFYIIARQATCKAGTVASYSLHLLDIQHECRMLLLTYQQQLFLEVDFAKLEHLVVPLATGDGVLFLLLRACLPLFDGRFGDKVIIRGTISNNCDVVCICFKSTKYKVSSLYLWHQLP